jgi:outer membrane protein
MNKSHRPILTVRAVSLAMAGAVAVLSAGCVDQAREVSFYRKQLDALPGVQSVPVPVASKPLTVQEAMRLAEQNDESLGLSGESYVQALIAKDKEFSTFLPQISLNPSLNESQRFRGETGPSHNFNIPLGASGNLFNGFRDEASLDQDTATIEQNRQNLLNEQQIVLLDVVQTYYQVLQAERSVTVFESSLQEQDERVRQARAQYDLGNGTPLAVAQAESQASSTRVELIQARNTVIVSRAMLAFLIGAPVDDRPLIDGYWPPQEVDQSIDAWLNLADQSRQDLAAAAAAVDVAREQIRIAVGEYYPSITLDLNYLVYKEGQPLNQRLSAGLNANIPVFTAGQIEADVRAAYSQLRSALLSLSQARKQVEQDIRTGYANLQSSRDQIKELRVELAASARALTQAQAQYNVGNAIFLDVLTAQDNLLSTQLQLATQVYQEKIAYLNLLRVAGRLTLAAAAPSTRPANEPNDLLETTTPDVIRSTTLPAP